MQNRNLKFLLILFFFISLSQNIFAQDEAFYSLEEAMKNPLAVEILVLGEKKIMWNWDPFWIHRGYLSTLQPIPAEIANLKNLRKLDLTLRLPIKEDLATIPPAIFDLKNLTELDLSNNIIFEIPPEIGKLTKLKKLILRHNTVTSIPSEINKLKSLTELDLSYFYEDYWERYKRKQFPSEIFGLESLQKLNLSYGHFKELPSGIGKLRNLLELDLSYNDFQKLPYEIGNLVNLKRLNLSYIPWGDDEELKKFLSTIITKLINLEELNLGRAISTTYESIIFPRNNVVLENVPRELWELKSLKKLNLSGYEFSTLPPGIEKLINLTELDLRDNKIVEVPPGIFDLKNLRELDLRGNYLKKIPLDILKLKNLKRLSLSADYFEDLPTEINKIEHIKLTLKDLDIQISLTVEEDIPLVINRYKNFKSLTELNLRGYFSELPHEIFDLINLQKLNLNAFELSELPSNIGKLINLKELNLNGSGELKKLPFEILKLTNLEQLDLAGTRIRTLPNEISKLSNLKKLIIQLGSPGFFPHSEIAKLMGLNLEELQLYVAFTYGFEQLNEKIVKRLLPNTFIWIYVTSGANIEKRPDTVKSNADQLEVIKIILESNPQFEISVDDFLQNEAKANINTIEEKIKYRKNFIEFLLKKLKKKR